LIWCFTFRQHSSSLVSLGSFYLMTIQGRCSCMQAYPVEAILTSCLVCFLLLFVFFFVCVCALKMGSPNDITDRSHWVIDSLSRLSFFLNKTNTVRCGRTDGLLSGRDLVPFLESQGPPSRPKVRHRHQHISTEEETVFAVPTWCKEPINGDSRAGNRVGSLVYTLVFCFCFVGCRRLSMDPGRRAVGPHLVSCSRAASRWRHRRKMVALSGCCSWSASVRTPSQMAGRVSVDFSEFPCTSQESYAGFGQR